jgi:hypothetical protein
MTAIRSAAAVAGSAITWMGLGEVRCCPVRQTTMKIVRPLAPTSRATMTVDIWTGGTLGI